MEVRNNLFMANVVEIKINTEFITLGQFLKLTNTISNGGEAKHYLKNNEIKVNDVVDDRRGRKLYVGDCVLISDVIYKISK